MIWKKDSPGNLSNAVCCCRGAPPVCNCWPGTDLVGRLKITNLPGVGPFVPNIYDDFGNGSVLSGLFSCFLQRVSFSQVGQYDTWDIAFTVQTTMPIPGGGILPLPVGVKAIAGRSSFKNPNPFAQPDSFSGASWYKLLSPDPLDLIDCGQMITGFTFVGQGDNGMPVWDASGADVEWDGGLFP